MKADVYASACGLVLAAPMSAMTAMIRYDPKFRKEYLHRCHHKAKGVAKVAAARKLAIRLFWMLRTNKTYPEIVRI